ncbi:MAG: hypothetical protein AAF393_05665 [Pseudomonadota bacterium]
MTSEPISFKGLKKLPEEPFVAFCSSRKIKHKVDVEPDEPVSSGLEKLYASRQQPAFFQVIANALPVREAVWLACLAAEELVPEGAELPTTIKTAKAWVFSPNEDTRKAVEKAITDADMDDPYTLAADAAFHGKVKGLEDVVLSPPLATPTMVFAMLMKAALYFPEAEAKEETWQKLVGFGVNIASGGTGRLSPPEEGETSNA